MNRADFVTKFYFSLSVGVLLKMDNHYYVYCTTSGEFILQVWNFAIGALASAADHMPWVLYYTCFTNLKNIYNIPITHVVFDLASAKQTNYVVAFVCNHMGTLQKNIPQM